MIDGRRSRCRGGSYECCHTTRVSHGVIAAGCRTVPGAVAWRVQADRRHDGAARASHRHSSSRRENPNRGGDARGSVRLCRHDDRGTLRSCEPHVHTDRQDDCRATLSFGNAACRRASSDCRGGSALQRRLLSARSQSPKRRSLRPLKRHFHTHRRHEWFTARTHRHVAAQWTCAHRRRRGVLGV